MKYLPVLIILSSLILSMFTRSVFAQNLCVPACELIINFTDGGSIEAVEALSITFGEGGFINDGAVTTGYAKDEILALNAGDSLQFTAGGAFSLGDAGNIDYTTMNITAIGNVSLSTPPGGSSSVHGVSLLAIDGNLIFNSDVSLSAELDLSSSSPTVSNGSANLIGGTGTVTVEPAGSLILNNNQIISDATFSVTEINLQQSSGTTTFDPDSVAPVIVEGTITIGSTPLIPEGPNSITLLTQENLIAFEGVSIPTENGTTCTVQNGQCVDADGNIFTLVEGKLVLPQNNSGSITLISLLLLFSLFLFSVFILPRRRRTY